VVAAGAVWQAEGVAGIGGTAPERRIFRDGVLTKMARLRGRRPRGQRAVATGPVGHWQRLTILGALGTAGMLAAMSIEAATSGAVFLADLERVLRPELRRTKPDAVLVLDNLRAHKTRAGRKLLDRSGFPYRYLPSDSPDLSPIEPAWAKLKAELRRGAARTAEMLHQALGPALRAITAQDAAGFFRHAGYSRPN
jgi:transposase